MLKKLRINLTLLCLLITGAILFFITIIELGVYEKQMATSAQNAFENVCNSITYRIQFENIIRQSWLHQTEAENRMMIFIDDNGHPILFNGTYAKDKRSRLLAVAKDIAANKHGFDINAVLTSTIQVQKIFFSFSDENHPYLGSISLIPSSNGKSTVVAISDMAFQHQEILSNRLRVFGLGVLGLILLFIFSWWFSGRAIAPIEASQKNQT